jgi:hypothetical protein
VERGDPYRIVWNGHKGFPPELKEIEEHRKRPSWGAFHKACGGIEVYFDNYVSQRGRVSVRVFTTKPNRRIERVVDLVYLCRGEGHDAISASIDGLRKSGGSSLEAWLAALAMQIEQLEGLIG